MFVRSWMHEWQFGRKQPQANRKRKRTCKKHQVISKNDKKTQKKTKTNIEINSLLATGQKPFGQCLIHARARVGGMLTRSPPPPTAGGNNPGQLPTGAAHSSGPIGAPPAPQGSPAPPPPPQTSSPLPPPPPPRRRLGCRRRSPTFFAESQRP